MASKIQAFQSTFDKGVARPNLFSVEFPTTPLGGQWNNDRMELRVQSVTMPGKNITTTPNDNAYGPSYEMANGISYADEVEVTFILDQTHDVRELINMWQDKVVNPSTFNLNYYEEYIGSMIIYQLDQNDQAASAIMLEEVYPKTVGPIAYSMDSTNSFLTVSVSFAFRRWVPIVVNFQGITAAQWVSDDNGGNGLRYDTRPSVSSELYKISQKFGINIPSNVTSAIGKLNFVQSAISNPENFLKRTVQQGFGGLFGGF